MYGCCNKVRMIVFGVAMFFSCGAIGVQAEIVEYQVTFEATWSLVTHPQDFPPNPHFSGLIGATHNASATFWLDGGAASMGIENMAELGSKTALTNEATTAIGLGDAFSVLSGGGISPSPGTVTLTFSISDTHPLVTLVSMLAPSPDWFVGVSGLDLSDGSGNWLNTVVVDLDPYDSGTDSGPIFTSANDDTQPPDPIANLSTIFPFTGTGPVGKFTFELLTVPAVPTTSFTGLAIMAVFMSAAGVFIIRKQM